MPLRPYLAAIGTTFVVLVFVGSRLDGLTSSCLWFDEVFSLHAAEHSWDTILGFVAQDLIHPPLFYLILKIWVVLGGDGLLWTRSLPVFISLAAIPVFIKLSRELGVTTGAMLIALFLIAINGALIKYAQEVRMYSLLMLLSLTSSWIFVRYLNGKSSISLLTLTNVLLVYTHYFGWLVIAAEIVIVAMLHRRRSKQIALMGGVAAAAFLPWAASVAYFASQSTGFVQNIGWMQRPGPREAWVFLLDLTEPFYSQPASTFPQAQYSIAMPMLFVLGLGTLLAFRRVRDAGNEREQLHLLAVFVALPVVAAFLLSWVLPYSIWGTRHLIIVFVPAAILAAQGLMRLNNATLKYSLLVSLAIFSLAGFALNIKREVPRFAWCELESMAGLVTSDPRNTPVRRIYVVEDLAAYHVWFALRNSGPEIETIKLTGIDGLNEDAAFFLPRAFDGVRTAHVNGLNDDRLVIAFRGQAHVTALIGNSLLPLGYGPAQMETRESSGENAYIGVFERSR